MAVTDILIPPRSTYRLQFHAGFGFPDAAAIASYLARLGISHVYASPYLKAQRGSIHGYDIVDHSQLNPELGDEAAFRQMVAAFQANGLKQILDFVPNHMGVGGADNLWWLDVLEWGEQSDYAGWFDIDWEPDPSYLHGKLLVPFLGDQYGAVLETGDIELRFDSADGTFAVWAHGVHKLPICPLHYQRVLGDAEPELERLGDAFADLPSWRPRVMQRAKNLQAELAALAGKNASIRREIETAVRRFNGRPGEPATWQALDVLIRQQHWRAAHFRVAGDDINYRRFFSVNELAGVRIELPELFDHAHKLVFTLMREGAVDGLRIDHVDGLFDPAAYLAQLRQSHPRPFYLLVEKILAQHESLREDWPVEGTTGYEFSNVVLGILVDPEGEAGHTRSYEGFAGPHAAFAQIVHDCKMQIMTNEMASELNGLARDAARLARENPRTSDFTHNILQRAIREIVTCFPVYRTYVDARAEPSEIDHRDIDWAVSQARRQDPTLAPSVFDFLQRALTTDLVGVPRSGFSRQAVTRFAMRVQQYTGPVMAKGVEDTAFYRYNRFVALNEVGGYPDRFGLSLAAFHKANAQRASRSPHAMVSTATHDTKRGEDTRARLAVLSEMPEEWSRQVQAWSRILRARQGDIDGTAAPSRNDEYLFYQLLLGAWPPELTSTQPLEQEPLAAFRDRIGATMVKSVREAKQHSSWAAPDTAYEKALTAFIDDAFDTGRQNSFLDVFLPFQARVAELGVRNSIVQTALKLTVPGVPDIYQGAELWDFSFVDPDNRRPVNFRARSELLERTLAEQPLNRSATVCNMLDRWQDGGIKIAIVHALLDHRSRQPELYSKGNYQSLEATGPKANHICAFWRHYEADDILVVASRFPAQLDIDTNWAGTGVVWPSTVPMGSTWQDLLSGRLYECKHVAVETGVLLSDLPVAVLALLHDNE